ncbi:MAG: cation-translocating P-type ATPase [Planctomycetes bacterium]|nr:cation-translocating P-type ATPase [Planctomycetota bacterium]
MAAVESARIPVRSVLPTSAQCRSCRDLVLEGLRGLPGVASSELDAGHTEFLLTFRPAETPEADLRERARGVGEGICRRMRHETFSISGMDCPDCAAQISAAVRRLPGVCTAEVNFLAGHLSLEYDQERVSLDPVARIVRRLGYRLHQGKWEVRGQTAEGRGILGGYVLPFLGTRGGLRTLVAGGLLLAATVGASGALPAPTQIALFLLSLAVSGLPIAAQGAYRTFVTRSLDMYALMTLACTGAAAVGDWPEAATAMFLFSLGTTLERFTFDRARGSIRSLLDQSPARARVRRGAAETEVAVEEVRLGERILSRPGERLALDGVVRAGRSFVDQAAITGESAPVLKEPGSEVFAGTLNGDGLLEVEVTRLAENTTLGRIVHMVEDAQQRRAPAQQMVDRFARWYTPAVIGVALLMTALPFFAGSAALPAFRRALVLLVVACPCALVISTPVSILAAVANASRHGVLIKGGVYLEALASLRAVIFDKTGTLTRARPVVTLVFPGIGWTEDAVLALAASLESASEHPLARSLVERARAHGLPLEAPVDFRALPGLGAEGRLQGRQVFLGSRRFAAERGVELPDALAARVDGLEAEGASAAIVWDERGVAGVLGLADPLRDEAPAALRELRAEGVGALVMLTGDNERTARSVAEALGIDDVRAGLLPQEKVAAVEELLGRYGSVAMVGDGVNDAPALARASVGIVMGAVGSDAALETADVGLMSDDLSRLPYLLRLGRATVSVIRQNIAASVLVKGLFFLMSLSGWVNLWMAVASDLGVSLLVTLNGMRLFDRRVAGGRGGAGGRAGVEPEAGGPAASETGHAHSAACTGGSGHDHTHDHLHGRPHGDGH